MSLPHRAPASTPLSPAEIDVLCVGNAIVDVLAHATDGFLAAEGLTKGTMALIDADAAHALYDAMGPGVEISGGSAANTAAGIASFGGRAAFVGKVAADQLGEVFAHDLRSTGVRFDVPPAPQGSPATARCLVLVTPDAQRTLNTFLGASVGIGPADIDPGLVAASSVLYCEGYLWDSPSAREAILVAMEAATTAGRTVAFTLSDPFCVERHRAEFVDLVTGRVDVLFANEAEITALFEVDTVDAAVAAIDGRVGIVCVTRSEHGSVIATADGQRLDVPAAPVDAVVDTTGAGDLFAAGFLFGLTAGHDLESCARLGSAAASEVISHVGARPQIPLSSLLTAG